jgi:hypothetical protein
MTVNYRGILTLEIIGFFTTIIYHGKSPLYFIASARGANVTKLLLLVNVERASKLRLPQITVRCSYGKRKVTG